MNRLRIALFAMPDNASSFDNVMRLPNLGLASIAAFLPDDDVSIYDLVLTPKGFGAAARRILVESRPELVGFSAMSFQYESARKLAKLCREILPNVKTVVGGYHATVMADEILREDGVLFDFVVRGEGEIPVRELADSLAGRSSKPPEEIRGLSYRDGQGAIRHNERAPLLDLRALPSPAREHRRLDGFTYFGRRFDCVETSRGCTFPCTFCSIRSMYGPTFRERPIEDVVAEVLRLRDEGVEGVFFVDDNITLNLPRFKELCRELAKRGCGGMEMIVQSSVQALARDPDAARLMSEAGIRLVFLGIENGSEKNLALYKKREVNLQSALAVRRLHDAGIIAVGGIIVGNPDDDAAAVRDAFAYVRRLRLDHAVVLSLQPYPGTELRKYLEAERLITNPNDYSKYNGFISNVRTRHLTSAQLARLIGWESITLNLSPSYLFNSKLISRYRPFFLPLLRNTFNSLIGGVMNRMFETTSRF